MRLAAALLALLAALPAPVAADPSAVQGAVRHVLDQGGEAEVLAALARRLAGGIETPTAPAAPALPDAAVRVETGEIQAALTQLSILVGGNGQLTLQRAQGGRSDVVQILSGTAGLDDLAASNLVRRKGQVWHLTRPLVIWPGAALALTPGQVLDLDTEAGAFLLSFGAVSLQGATIRGDTGQNATVPDFRPFLLIAGQGALRADRAAFQGLGFPGPAPFHGLSVLTAGLLQPVFPTSLTYSRVTRVHSLGFEGTNGLILAGNRVTGAGGAAIRVADAQSVTLTGNRIQDTGQGAGLRLTGQLAKLRVTDNRILSGGGNGVQIDGIATGLILSGNVVLDNDSAGIVLGPSACVTIRGNILAINRTTGLRLVGTSHAEVTDNAIHRNGSAGIELQDRSGQAPVALSGNVLAGNREGLRAAGLGEVRLTGNDLSDQIPRQFAGDFAPWLGPYLTAGEALVIPVALGTKPGADAPCKTE